MLGSNRVPDVWAYCELALTLTLVVNTSHFYRFLVLVGIDFILKMLITTVMFSPEMGEIDCYFPCHPDSV